MECEKNIEQQFEHFELKLDFEQVLEQSGALKARSAQVRLPALAQNVFRRAGGHPAPLVGRPPRRARPLGPAHGRGDGEDPETGAGRGREMRGHLPLLRRRAGAERDGRLHSLSPARHRCQFGNYLRVTEGYLRTAESPL